MWYSSSNVIISGWRKIKVTVSSSEDASLLFLSEGMLKTAAVAVNHFSVDVNL